MIEERTRQIGNYEVPSATRMRIFNCPDPSCKHLHLIGYDYADEPFCEIVISREQADQIDRGFPK